MSVPAYVNERWFGLLVEAVGNHPRGRQGVADRLGAGFSRPMISLVMSGKYANPGTVARRVMEVFDRNACPYLGMEIDTDQCIEVNSGPVPTWDPAALDQRRCCQTCPHAPTKAPLGGNPKGESK